MKNSFDVVVYNSKAYVVATCQKGLPFVFDYEDLDTLLDLRFFSDHSGYIKNQEKLLHRLVMGAEKGSLSIDHINRRPRDNRKANLRPATGSEQNKNKSKMPRTVDLPDNCGIKPEEIPTLIWFRPKDEITGHDNRWVVEMKDNNEKVYLWKSTSRRDLSLKCKFEMAKKHLRIQLNEFPQLFDGHCLNGELSDIGKTTDEEYCEIVRLAGYDASIKNDQSYVLQQDTTGMSDNEIKELERFNGINTSKYDDILELYDLGPLPQYCQHSTGGDGFVYEVRQGQVRFTRTFCSSKKTIPQKYQEVVECAEHYRTHPIPEQELRGRAALPADFPYELPRHWCYESNTQSFSTTINHPKGSRRCSDPNMSIVERFNTLKDRLERLDVLSRTPEQRLYHLDEEQSLFLMKLKEETSAENARTFFNEEYRIIIKRDLVSKFWQGKFLPRQEIMDLPQYQHMITCKKARTRKLFSEEQLNFVKEQPRSMSLGEVVSAFKDRFNKSITASYISQLRKREVTTQSL